MDVQYDFHHIRCDWRDSYPEADLSHAGEAAPTGSVPVPVVFGASAAYPMGHLLLNTRVGGAVPEAALRVWRSIRLRVGETEASNLRWRDDYNVTLMQQPDSFFTRGLSQAPSLSEVNERRYQQPLSYMVDEAELNAPSSSFSLGSDVVMTHTKPYWYSGLQPTFTSLESGDSGASGAAWLGTGSPRRLGHATAGAWDTTIVSGGRSGTQYSSEWVSYELSMCCWPEDPSYAKELGAMRFVSLVTESFGRSYVYERYWLTPGVSRRSEYGMLVGPDTLGAFRAGDPIEGQCATGWHFEPPLITAAETAVLTCSGCSQWVDVGLGGIRRCARDRLDCAWPLEDGGYEACVEPLPVLRSATVYTSQPTDKTGQLENADAVTVVGLLPRSVREYVLLGSSRYRQIDIVRTGSHGLIGG